VSSTVRNVLDLLRLIFLEVIPFATAVYQHLSKGDTEVYWPYRRRRQNGEKR
jgi:hypothetical protein